MADVVSAPLEIPVHTGAPAQGDLHTASAAEERVSVASQWQLMWWRFRKHKLALVAGVVVLLFYGALLDRLSINLP
jgi:peptide/nickel transport system permease protein